MMGKLVAAVKVDDSGTFVRGFGVTDVTKTGDDSNFTVRVQLDVGINPIDKLYPQVTLSDARVGVTADLSQATIAPNPVMVDVAVESDHTSGFWLLVFKHC